MGINCPTDPKKAASEVFSLVREVRGEGRTHCRSTVRDVLRLACSGVYRTVRWTSRAAVAGGFSTETATRLLKLDLSLVVRLRMKLLFMHLRSDFK